MNRGFVPLIIIIVGLVLVYLLIGGLKMAHQQYIIPSNQPMPTPK